jgi:O-antigen ligase
MSIKAIVLLWLGTGIGILLWRWFVGKRADRLIPQSIQLAIFAIPASVYLLPDINLWLIFMVLLVPICCAMRNTPPLQAYICLLALVPAVTYSTRIGSAYLFDLSGHEVLGIGFGIAAFSMPRAPGRPNGVAADILFSLVILTLFAFQIQDGEFGARKLAETVTTMIIPYMALRRTITSPKSVELVATGIVFSAIILSGIAVIEWLWRWPIYHSAYAHFGIDTPGTSAWAKMRGSNLRIPATFIESTAFGVFLALAVIATACQRQIFRTRNRQYLALALLAFVTFQTYSRGAVVAIFIGTVAMMTARGLLARTFATVAAFGLLGALTFALASWNSGLEDIIRPEAGGKIEYRSEFWRLGTEMLRENPWTGYTSKAVNDYMKEITGEGFVDPVNTYLYFSIRAGLTGGLVMVLSVLVPMLFLWLARRRLPTYSQQSNLGMVFGWLSIMAFNFAVTSFHERNPLWLFLCLAMTAGLLGSPRKRKLPTINAQPQEA